MHRQNIRAIESQLDDLNAMRSNMDNFDAMLDEIEGFQVETDNMVSNLQALSRTMPANNADKDKKKCLDEKDLAS